MKVQPYLVFEGRCQEAIDFYRQALGAEVQMVMHFKDSPDPAPAPPDKVMHAALRIGDTEIYMSDGRCGGTPAFRGFSLSLSPPDDAAAQAMFAALGDGGAVTMPLTKTFFASSFGMIEDRFGVSWMIMAQS